MADEPTPAPEGGTSDFIKAFRQGTGEEAPPAPAPPAGGEPTPAPPAGGDPAPDPFSPPADLSEAGKVNWQKLRDELKTAKEAEAAMRATQTDLEAQAALHATELNQYREKFPEDRFKALDEEATNLRFQLAQHDLGHLPEVKQARETLKREQGAAQERAKDVLKGMPGLETVLDMDPKERDRRIEAFAEEKEISAQSLSRVWTALDALDRARGGFEEARQKASVDMDTWKAKQEEARIRQTQEMKARGLQMFKEGLRRLQAEDGAPEFFLRQQGEDHKEHNALVDEAVNYTRKILTESLDANSLGEVAFYAGMGRTALQRQQVTLHALASVRKENQALKERVRALEGAAPPGYRSGTPAPGGDPAKSQTPFIDAYRNHMANG